MAKAKKRWAVRYEAFCRPHECRPEDTSYAIIVASRKPYKRNGKWIGLGYAGRGDYRNIMSVWEYEGFFPRRFHLPPGGGPVEIRFVDEE